MKRYFLVLICQNFLSLSLYSQGWVQNIITDYFENKYVTDVSVSDSCIWFLGKGLVKYDGINFTEYSLTPFSSGSLDNYKSNKIEIRPFYMKTNRNIVFLYDLQTNRILKIENEFIYNYKSIEKGLFFTDVDTDYKHNIWAIVEDEKGYKSKAHLYKVNYDNIERYYLPLVYDSMNIQSFYFSKDYTYIILSNHFKDSIQNKLLLIDSENVIKELNLNPYKFTNYEFEFYSVSKFIYLLSGSQYLYKILNSELIETYKIDSNFHSCFDFVLADDKLYFSYGSLIGTAKFFEYHLDSNSSMEIPLISMGFRSMVVYRNWIIGTNSLCEYSSFGIGAYEYK